MQCSTSSRNARGVAFYCRLAVHQSCTRPTCMASVCCFLTGQQSVTAVEILAAATLGGHRETAMPLSAAHIRVCTKLLIFCFCIPQVSAYLLSPDFRAKVAARRAAGRRGIIINAGGPHLVASTIVTLKVCAGARNRRHYCQQHAVAHNIPSTAKARIHLVLHYS